MVQETSGRRLTKVNEIRVSAPGLMFLVLRTQLKASLATLRASFERLVEPKPAVASMDTCRIPVDSFDYSAILLHHKNPGEKDLERTTDIAISLASATCWQLDV